LINLTIVVLVFRWFVLQDNGVLQYFKSKDATDPLGEIDIGDVMAARFSEKVMNGVVVVFFFLFFIWFDNELLESLWLWICF
jgi:hypothetical protein